MIEVVVTTGAIRLAKFQSNVTISKSTPNFLQAICHSCHPTNSVKPLKGMLTPISFSTLMAIFQVNLG